MSEVHEGGCLCGAVRYQTRAAPLRVTVCHCRFCQRFTGSAFLVEPIFRRADVALSGAAPSVYDHVSGGSGKRVSLHYCGRCSAALYLSFERFPEVIGLCAGTLDDPNWFDRGPGACRHIFTASAQRGVVLPAGVELYEAHAVALDGAPNTSVVLAQPMMVGG